MLEQADRRIRAQGAYDCRQNDKPQIVFVGDAVEYFVHSGVWMAEVAGRVS